MITCAELLRELSNYLDGEVEPQLRQELETHLKSCKRCWVLVHTTRKTLRILVDKRIIELPAGFSERLRVKLAGRIAELGSA